MAVSFQSTRPRGARLYPYVEPDGRRRFQSTRPRGARLLGASRNYKEWVVSIHAPTRGATGISLPALHPATSFNPRAHAGRDPEPVDAVSVIPEFQSTRPRGARPNGCPSSTLVNPFQSTRPRGARPAQQILADALTEFQSTRPRGARPWSGSRSSRSGFRFNPRAHAGRDRFSRLAWPSVTLFQSTRPRGARQMSDHLQSLPTVFQSTRPRGARLSSHRARRLDTWCFNPRAHAGRDGKR